MSSVRNELVVKEGVNVSMISFSDILKGAEVDFKEDAPRWSLWQQQEEQISKRIVEGCAGIH